MDDIEYISTHLSRCEVLAQLAEEAAELAQAALKLRRAMGGVNPTPVAEAEAWDNLVEEHADVSLCLCLCALFSMGDVEKANAIVEAKAARWRQRLEERHG